MTIVPAIRSAGQEAHQPTTPTFLPSAEAMFQMAGTRRLLPVTGTVRPGLRILLDEVQDAVAVGRDTGGDGGPDQGRQRRDDRLHGAPGRAVEQVGEPGHAPALHPRQDEVPVEAVETEDQDAAVGDRVAGGEGRPDRLQHRLAVGAHRHREAGRRALQAAGERLAQRRGRVGGAVHPGALAQLRRQAGEGEGAQHAGHLRLQGGREAVARRRRRIEAVGSRRRVPPDVHLDVGALAGAGGDLGRQGVVGPTLPAPARQQVDAAVEDAQAPLLGLPGEPGSEGERPPRDGEQSEQDEAAGDEETAVAERHRSSLSTRRPASRPGGNEKRGAPAREHPSGTADRVGRSPRGVARPRSSTEHPGGPRWGPARWSACRTTGWSEDASHLPA